MSQRVSENIIICVDVSRSMYRKDYIPNRLESCIKALQILVSTRLQKDPSTSFAIITISDNPKLVLDFNSNE
ncbi:MAG: VWA domain-containing protein, partial [Candidatus Lokiarchaeota archaeon]|nr:VWA domain-containing protein [Candidatus Lokiarchaeota archaeon]